MTKFLNKKKCPHCHNKLNAYEYDYQVCRRCWWMGATIAEKVQPALTSKRLCGVLIGAVVIILIVLCNTTG